MQRDASLAVLGQIPVFRGSVLGIAPLAAMRPCDRCLSTARTATRDAAQCSDGGHRETVQCPQGPARRYLGMPNAITRFCSLSPCPCCGSKKLLAGACCWSGRAAGLCQGSKQVLQAAQLPAQPSRPEPDRRADVGIPPRCFRQGRDKPQVKQACPATLDGRCATPTPAASLEGLWGLNFTRRTAACKTSFARSRGGLRRPCHNPAAQPVHQHAPARDAGGHGTGE